MASLFLQMGAAHAQVRVEYTGEKELKRSAHQLRIPTEQLKNAREALREATDVALHQDEPRGAQYGQLARLSMRLDRTKCEETVRQMFSDLRQSAQNANDPDYQRLSAYAQNLVMALADFDPEKSAELVAQWPAPSASASATVKNVWNQFRRQSEMQH